ncbi:OsmC family protein [Bowdeniella nasicola]|uniref:OsmC family protein n=1 Tax=Bowdeniella nasicola TaxID=208480 RepID=UPI0009F83A5F|nr:OsmC family protein [Bowdeniella nasicola]
MSTQPTPPSFPTEPDEGQSARPPILLRRLGTRTFVATAPRGQQITVGPADVPGAITPGELLQIALAGCNAMSADARMEHALGEDHNSVWWVRAIFDKERDAYAAFDVVADPETGDKDVPDPSRVHAAISRTCTVGHTLEESPAMTVTFRDEIFKE